MAMYEKLPEKVEAFQLGVDEMPLWFKKELREDNVITEDNILYIIKTLNGGTIRANVGDYIIKGINGVMYPSKKEIFEENYKKIQ